jgi:hypothetical protein
MGFMVNPVDDLNPWRDSRAGVNRGIPEAVTNGEVAGEGAIDRAIYRHKIDYLLEHPSLALRIGVVNGVLLFYPIQGDTGQLNPALLFCYVGIVLGILSAGSLMPASSSPRMVVVMLGGCYLLASLVYQGQPGYRTPVEPLVIFTGLLGWREWGWSGGIWRRGAAALAYAGSWGASFLWTPDVRERVVEGVKGFL